jgi:hypothetical protein
VACRTRIRAAHTKCPACGSGDLWTAQKAGARLPAKRSFAERLYYASIAPILVGGAGVGVWLCGSALAGQLERPPSTTDRVSSWIVGTLIGIPLGALGGMVVLIVGVGVVAWLFGTVFGWRHRPPRPSAAKSLERIDAAHVGEILRGKVVAGGPTLSAPGDGAPCVAFRIEGTVDGFPVDDSAAVPFVIETAEGERVEVAALPGTFDIPTSDRALLDAAALHAVRAFLAVRGLAIDASDVALAVGALHPGDDVEVSGTGADRPDPDASAGFRAAATRRAIAETADTPLVVRAPRP